MTPYEQICRMKPYNLRPILKKNECIKKLIIHKYLLFRLASSFFIASSLISRMTA